MSIGTALQFIVSHNTLIIEGLIAGVLLLVIYLAYRGFRETTSPQVPTASLEGLEATLQKLLEKAQHVPKPAAGAVSAPETNAAHDELLMQIDQLRAELQTKQTTIEELKTTGGGAAGGGVSDSDRKVLEGQLQDLQAKLAEYEIISDDIADLSKYKEENIRLQKEIEKIRTAGPAKAAPVEDVMANVAPSAELAATPEVAAAPTPAIAPAAAPVAPAAVATEAVGDDLMAEFAKAVDEQKAATAAPEAAPSAEENVLPEVNMDKMIAEASGIDATGAAEVSAEEALGAGLDENKLLQEADALNLGTQISQDDAQLLGEFENFVKKKEKS